MAAFWWPTPLLIALVAALQWIAWSPLETHAGSGFDSGIFAYCGRALAAVGSVYAACTDNKPPGIFLINAFASTFADAADDWRPIWSLAVVAQVAAWLGVVALLRPLLGARAWVAAAVGVYSLFVIYDGVVTVEIFSLPLQILVATVCLQAGRGARGAGWRFGVAGGALAILFLLRANHIGVGVLVAGSLWHTARQQSVRRAVVGVLCAIGGGITVAAGVLAASGGLEALDGMLTFAIRQNAAYSAATVSARIAAGVSNLMWVTVLVSPIAAGCLFVLDPAAVLIRGKRLMREGLLPMLLLWLLGELALSAVSGRRYPHYAQLQLIPTLLVLAVVLAGLLERHGVRETAEGTGRPWAIGRAAVFSLVLPSLLLLPSILPTIRAFASPNSPDRALRNFTVRLASRLDSLGASDGGVFLWGAPPAVYILLGTGAPVRHISSVALTTPGFSTDAYVREVVQCLEGSRPLLIADGYDGTQLGMSAGPTPVPSFTAMPLLDTLRAYVRSAYVREGLVSGTGVALWRRRPAERGAGRGPTARDCRPVRGQWRL